jgi:hypothetical protein
VGDLARLQEAVTGDQGQGSGGGQRKLARSGGSPPSGDSGPLSQTPNLYCLASSHDPRLLTEARFFWADPNDPSCPVCPVCDKQVQAQALEYNAKGQPVIPRNLLSLADRIGERV